MPPGSNEEYAMPSLEEGFAKTIKYTIKFCMKHNMKMIFAWKRAKEDSIKNYNDELAFYKKHLNDIEFNYLVSNSTGKRDQFSSYMAMFQSDIAVGTYTTMLREKLGIGEKILSCNCIYSDIFDFPIGGLCLIKNCNFQEFEKRLLDIHSISKENYFSRLNKDKCYILEYDKKISTTEMIRKEIDSFLVSRSSGKKSTIEKHAF